MDGCRVAVFARKYLGQKTIEFLMENFPEDLICVCLDDTQSEIEKAIISKGFAKENILYLCDLAKDAGKQKLIKFNLDYIILAWWPYILKKDIIKIPKKGVLNYHNALLPHNAGMHSNFWSIIEQRPYGVTIHFVDEKIDSGDIIFQQEIATSWEDTGKTLYDKSIEALLHLFIESYPLIRIGNYIRVKQDKSLGSFHYGKELFEKIRLDVDATCKVRDFLNLLRAQNFPPYEGCYFIENGCKYEVQVQIKKIDG